MASLNANLLISFNTFAMKIDVLSVCAFTFAIPLNPALAQGGEPDTRPMIAYEETIEMGAGQHAAKTGPAISRTMLHQEPLLAEAGGNAFASSSPHAVFAGATQPSVIRATAPAERGALAIGGGTAFRETGVFSGGKLLLTNGVATIEGASGGGLASWSTIAGREMDRGIGASGHFTAIELPDFGWRSYGFAIGVADRIELSYARQNFDTRAVGAALGLGRGYTLNQDVYGAKIKLFGDAIYGAPLIPQIAAGAQYKRSLDPAVVGLLGATSRDGVDYTLSATKLLLEHSILVNATARLTKANQAGLLGFGSTAGEGYQLQFEGSVAYQLSSRAVFGAEFRTKPDNLGLGEDDWFDLFAAYALTDNLTVSAAYVDLGSVATFPDQRGGFLQAQIAF